MKKLALQHLVTVSTLLATLSYAGIASAHTASGALGAAASSVDVYQTTCSKNAAGATGKFLTKVKSTKTGALVSVQATKGKLASHTTDAKGADATFSPEAKISAGGEGLYTVLVNKSGAGAGAYAMEAHCQTAAGKHTNQTVPVQVQNQ